MQNGVIIVNKPSNWTSRDVVNKVGRILGTKKIGHTGTLDPMATGVLVLCFGKLTKLVNLITDYQKEYIATIRFGIKTDTLDITGNVLETADEIIERKILIDVLDSFKGKSEQEVPIYSAKKIAGKKLYQYARNQEEIVLPKQAIEIFEVELLSLENQEATFRVVVSKGTYIRSLIRDICNKLNVLGTMSALKRTKQGQFFIEDAYTIEEIEQQQFQILTIPDLLCVETIELSRKLYQKVKNGNVIEYQSESPYLLFTYSKQEIALYYKKEDSYKVMIMLENKDV